MEQQRIMIMNALLEKKEKTAAQKLKSVSPTAQLPLLAESVPEYRLLPLAKLNQPLKNHQNESKTVMPMC
uniref:Uncharacterized protein n=1 Tax=Romanomermis culicivorax TaxID=13658 RepID=A0A915K1C2_ROMCU